ncbi:MULTISPECIES: glyceraldehyde-3-phosphate dehydrogenase [Pseudoalteromonas]|jgi:glyceraldehyde 3-phosphate dehydrogenase|uniref:Glyceraldehyde-3-phosphate dehydrogenase n=3 Tax=Pseudoalteromonas TaxID=53246 RepID=A0AAD0XCF4_9GAMM|nr:MULTISPECIES: glyceraldehyde-3-phosphate dehydrogenase [Pseudoalteromonas]MAJ38854.1 aldehyde dehydrogenase [Pseudoalteromonadaceae bacterium]MCP4056701.1 glyceraldehyde-3-phosphate dehydrogenase [Pseudoalteromonas sp.]MDC9522959.1 glyceraldehyde-3-phosphate dehydrogenase [Pseudoalteromonas sp. Angola-31]MDY6887382.1 glyceraldehyde-3-phosphate dehydrogenase [Pseudomonadota bacterium]OUX92582.1 MAG: aldehyde dehydrogenase [Pseudoalteromonas sp. TMED43]|tara:strand:- start:2488 stop:3930 length:1443 start_codon:yes stop_codon:yes gene_type:complete
MTSSHELEYTNSWQERQDYAESMQPIIGKLYRNRGIEIAVYGRPLVNASTIDIIKSHKTVAQFEGTKLRLRESFPFLEAISKMELNSARIDIGKLAYSYLYSDAANGRTVDEFVKDELAEIADSPAKEPRDVVLYGFGRIGRLLARLLIEKSGPYADLRLRAIVVRGGKEGDLEKRASLLRRDSIHGPFNGSITIDTQRNAIKANGSYIQVIYANSPSEVDYTAYGIENALVVDNTGIWKDEAGLGQHLESKGAAKVLLTAPAKGNIKNIVYGVNNQDIKPEDKIVCAASCTTNAITPTLKALNDKFGINNGHVETVHSYTNDQNLIDNYHKAERRGRAAALNMVITETGAAKAVSKALPELEGKLTGNAIRVPTPNVSLAILNLNLNSSTSVEELNAFLRETALHSELRDQIDYTASTEIVSTDLVGSRYAGVVDSQATIVEGNRVVLYVWYDNEFGYSCQVVRCMRDMAEVAFPSLPR